MRKVNRVLMAALVAAGLVSMTDGTLLPSAAAAAAAEGQKLGAKIVKPLKAAQEAMNAKNWDLATASLDEARAIEPKSPYEAFMVDELGWYVLLQQKDYVGAAAALERAVASGFVPPTDLPQRTKALAQLNYQTQNYPKAIEFGNRFLESTPGDAEIGVLVAQAYYMQKDYAGTRAAVAKLTAGQAKPSEQLLLLGLRSNYELKDRAATVQSLEALVRHYPQPKYWEDLLSNQLYLTKGDREMRALYRLMDDTRTLDKPEEYSEMAGVLVTGGFPTEAQGILERGMSANLFQGDARTRAESELSRARSGADADRKELPGAAQSLAAARTGNEMVSIGKLYFSVGEHAKAADAIQKGLAKGGVTDADDANALLGIALARSGKATEARTAFDAIRDPKLAEVTRYWKLYLDASAAPGATSAPAPAPADAAEPTAGS